MIFFATKPVDPKKRADEKPVPLSSSDTNGVEMKPRLVFKIKLPPADNKGKESCKVLKDKVDEKPAVLPTPSSGGMNGTAEKKQPHVLKIKLPKKTGVSVNKGNESFIAECKGRKAAGVIKETDSKLVATTSGGIGIRNGKINPLSHRPKKSAPSFVTKDRSSDVKSLPTSSTGINGTAARKACLVMRDKLPTPNNKGIELTENCDPKKAMDEKKERRVMKINLSAIGRNKVEQLNVLKTAVQVQQTGAKSTEKRCLEKVALMDEEALELKLEASKSKLQQRYQQAQNAKRKIEFLDFKDIPKPQNQNAPKRSRNQLYYRRS